MSGSSASIDDLLGHEEEAPPARVRRRGSPAGWLVRTLAMAAAFTAVVVFGLRLFSIGVAVPAVFAGLVALLTLHRVAAQVAAPPPAPARLPPDPARDDGSYNWSGTSDALRDSVNRWETKLVWSKGEPDRFANGVLPAIGELVDERLRLRHGLTRDSDPARARALLGEELWTFLNTHAKRTPAPRDLAAVVGQLEKI